MTPEPNPILNGEPAPRGNLAGFTKYLKYDLVSGLLVFLIALPLCIAISKASGFPPFAGVLTAIVGSVLTTFLSNSELTIKGPAAGLIVIVIGAVQSFGYVEGGSAQANRDAYEMALAVGVVAGVVQVAFGFFRAGVLGEFFPTAAVHGLLAAIGVIIMIKQLPLAVGQTAKGEPLEILRELPDKLLHANPQIALIGLVSLAILFIMPMIKARLKSPVVQKLPAQLIVLLVAIPMGIYFDLSHEHTYSYHQTQYPIGEQFLVDAPKSIFAAIAYPDFSVFTNPQHHTAALYWVMMFALIGSLESLLSAKAVDLLDPWKRKTNLNRDLVAVGVANTAVACIGGLPMISEIVRSKANIDNGARTRYANLWHGVFLLALVALAPALIHRVPLAALAAMLVFTGFRLASPREFINVFKTGPEQLFIFVATIIGVLATDLLVGIGIGISVKFLIHLFNGLPPSSMLKPYLEVAPADDDTVVISAKGSAVFTNWIPFRKQIEQLGLVDRNNVLIDLSGTELVDHSVMEKLHELEDDFHQAGLKLEIIGLEGHEKLSAHPHAARRKSGPSMRRLSVVADDSQEESLLENLIAMGPSDCIATIGAVGAATRSASGHPERTSKVRLELVVAPATCQRMLVYLRQMRREGSALQVVVDPVETLR